MTLVLHQLQRALILQAAGLGHFVIKVKQGPKATVASLLVKYKTDSVALRVINNCSEFSLHCRPHIYVPGIFWMPWNASCSGPDAFYHQVDAYLAIILQRKRSHILWGQ